MANFQIIQIAPTPKEQESWLPKTTIFASLYETLNSICNIEGEEDSTHELAKGQLILKCPFGVFKSTKKTIKFFVRISALASKKRSNQKSRVRESK